MRPRRQAVPPRERSCRSRRRGRRQSGHGSGPSLVSILLHNTQQSINQTLLYPRIVKAHARSVAPLGAQPRTGAPMNESRNAATAALVLRLSLGTMFIAHALLKYFVFTLP